MTELTNALSHSSGSTTDRTGNRWKRFLSSNSPAAATSGYAPRRRASIEMRWSGALTCTWVRSTTGF